MCDKPHPDDIRAQYQEVCESHRAITVFRAKLLTLLPLASGTGIYLLVGKDSSQNGGGIEHLAAIGLFGFSVTLGLFLHELRGIQQCGELIELGTALESNMRHKGHFSVQRKYYHEPRGIKRFYNNLKGPVGAAAVIYASVEIAWLYVAALGRGVCISRFAWAAAVVFSLIVVALIIWVPPPASGESSEPSG